MQNPLLANRMATFHTADQQLALVLSRMRIFLIELIPPHLKKAKAYLMDHLDLKAVYLGKVRFLIDITDLMEQAEVAKELLELSTVWRPILNLGISTLDGLPELYTLARHDESPHFTSKKFADLFAYMKQHCTPVQIRTMKNIFHVATVRFLDDDKQTEGRLVCINLDDNGVTSLDIEVKREDREIDLSMVESITVYPPGFTRLQSHS